jgi:phage gp46-like protein
MAVFGPNLLLNNSFEFDYTNWTIGLFGEIDTTIVRSGLKSSKLDVNEIGVIIAGPLSDPIIVDINSLYFADSWNNITSYGDGEYRILINYYKNLTGTKLISSDVIYSKSSVTTGWERGQKTIGPTSKSPDFTFPSDTLSIRLRQEISPNPDSIMTAYSDALSFSKEVTKSSVIAKAEGDIKFRYDLNTLVGDLSVVNDDLENELGLETAAILSIFTDRRANNDDILPNLKDDDRRGWWGDLLEPEVIGDKIGSRLWLLERSKTTQETLQKAEIFIRESLQWMVEDKVVKDIEVEVERQGTVPNDILAFAVKLIRNDGKDDVNLEFTEKWEGQL